MIFITSAQCRAARTLVGWSQAELAVAAQVGKATIANFEIEKTTPQDRTLRDIRAALEVAGVTFFAEGEPSLTGGPGVRPAAAPTPEKDE